MNDLKWYDWVPIFGLASAWEKKLEDGKIDLGDGQKYLLFNPIIF